MAGSFEEWFALVVEESQNMRCWQSWLLWIWVVDPSNCFPVSCNDTSLFAHLLLLGSVDHALLSR